MLEFLDVVDVERIGGTLSRDFEVARVVREWQGRGPVIVYRVEGCPQDSASNLLDLKFKLYKALGVGSDEEAYLKILNAMSSPARPSVVGGGWALPIILYLHSVL
jgi:3-polyprenyl-4-hydroxybenzoate decarboxylase